MKINFFIFHKTYTKTSDEYLTSGLVKADQLDYIGAIRDYKMAIKINPRNDEAYYNKGIIKAELHNYKGAIEDYTKAIEIDSHYFLAYYNRAIAKSKQKNHIEAIEDLNKALEINPKDELAYFKKGIIEITLGQIDNGCLNFKKAGELGYAKSHKLIKIYCHLQNSPKL